MIRITKIIKKQGYKLLLAFKNNRAETRAEVDMKPLLQHFVLTERTRMNLLLEDYSKFKTIRVNEEGTLEFPDILIEIDDFKGGVKKVPIDLNPEDIYRLAYPPEARDSVCAQLKINRILKGYTQKEVSEKANVSLKTIKEIEEKYKNPSLPTLQKIIKSLGLKIALLPNS